MNPNAKRDLLASDPKHLRLVAAIAQRVHSKLPPSFDIGDLIAVGNLALLNAADRYTVGKGTPFPLYARKWIRGAMLESSRRSRYTENTRPSIDDPGSSDLADEYVDIEKYGPEGLRALIRMATRPVLEISIDRGRRNRRISTAIARLPAAERQVLAAAFERDLSIREIGIHLGIPRGAARRLRADAIRQLRTELLPQRKAA